MDCRRFESLLDDLSRGLLAAEERAACARHADGCAACGELLALATLADGAAPAGLAAAVLARTSGPICERVELELPAFVDRRLAAADRELVAGHLAACGECAALAGVLGRLASELPRLASLPPDPGFVEAVLRRTLPVDVQLRRWWRRRWPQWLRRPRFASEVAYVGALVLVLVFATPGSPLEAVPQRALGVVRQPPVEDLGLNAAWEGRLTAARGRLGEFEARGRGLVESCLTAGARSVGEARAVAREFGGEAATLWRQAASLLGRDGDDAAHQSTNEENP